MTKTIAELEADLAETKAAIAKRRLEEKRARAASALSSWVARYESCLTTNEDSAVMAALATLSPAQLTLAKESAR